jgi:hypothetical protein
MPQQNKNDLAGLAIYGSMFSSKYEGDKKSKKVEAQHHLEAYGNAFSVAHPEVAHEERPAAYDVVVQPKRDKGQFYRASELAAYGNMFSNKYGGDKQSKKLEAQHHLETYGNIFTVAHHDEAEASPTPE